MLKLKESWQESYLDFLSLLPRVLLPQGRVVGKKSLTMLKLTEQETRPSAYFRHISNFVLVFFLQEGTNEEPVTVLLGNKSDLPEEDGSKVVKYKDGTRLADVSLNFS